MAPSQRKKGANQYTKRREAQLAGLDLLASLDRSAVQDEYRPAQCLALWENVRAKRVPPEEVAAALDWLTDAEDAFILQRIAGHPSLAPSSQLKLVNRCMAVVENDPRYAAVIAMGLARNPNLSTEAGEQLLMRYPDDVIKAEIRRHPNVPSNVLAIEALAALDFD